LLPPEPVEPPLPVVTAPPLPLFAPPLPLFEPPLPVRPPLVPPLAWAPPDPLVPPVELLDPPDPVLVDPPEPLPWPPVPLELQPQNSALASMMLRNLVLPTSASDCVRLLCDGLTCRFWCRARRREPAAHTGRYSRESAS
jgi:hypothetical protein